MIKISDCAENNTKRKGNFQAKRVRILVWIFRNAIGNLIIVNISQIRRPISPWG